MSMSMRILLLSQVLMVFLAGSAAARVCPFGDIDGNCEVDWEDLRLFSGQWLDGTGWMIQDLVAYWRFDESSGTIAYDSVGDNHGTINAAQWVSGKAGYALSFSTDGDYVDCGNDSSLDLTNNFSISVWIRLYQQFGFIVNKGNARGLSPGGAYTLYYSSVTPGTITFEVRNSSNNGSQWVTIYPFDPTEGWAHIVGTFSDGQLSIYKNGGFVESKSLSTTTINTNSGHLGIGANGSGSISVNGKIDDVRIYNWALSPAEVTALYNQGCSGFGCADLNGSFEVNASDFALLAEDWLQQYSEITVVINEFMADNDRFVQDPQGDFDDWIEFYNYGDIAFDIGGMYLTDDLNDLYEPNMWRIPDDLPAETNIPAHGYLLIWADNDTLDEPGLHANFRLSAGGEQIGLVDIDGSTLIDSITFGTQNGDESYGRFPDANDGWRVFGLPYGIPTPDSQNDDSFLGDAVDSVVVFNEIMYHPEANEAELEWVEFYNQMAIDVDLSGWSVVGGIRYHFPQGIIIPGGGFLVLAGSPNDLEAETGYADAYGPFEGGLSNTREKLWLRDNSNRIMNELNYRNGRDWPTAPDGSGVSLAKIDPDTASAPTQNWTWSAQVGGTPGADNGLTNGPSTLRINEVTSAIAAEFWVELVNQGGQSINLAGYILACTGTVTGEYVFPAQPIDPGNYLVLNESILGFHPADEDKLFLYTPGKSSVLDAVLVKNSLRARYPEGVGRWLYPNVNTPGSTNSFAFNEDIVINEIMYHHQPDWETETTPFADSNEEWVELYNRGVTTVDLSGWRFDDGIEYMFPPSTNIAPGGYLVVAKNTNYLQTLYPSIDIVGNFSLNLSNKGERIILLDANRNIADELRYYDDKPWPAYADGGGSSLELRDPYADNTRAEAWAASDESDKAGWQTYTYRKIAQASFGPNWQWSEFIMGLLDAGEILIDDISVLEDPDGAAIQFIQNGSFETGAGTWRFGGNHDKGQVITDPDNPSNKVLHLIATGPAENVYNHAETTLAGGMWVSYGTEYEISFRAKWLAGSPRLNTHLYYNRVGQTTLIEPGAPNGTPGAQNSCYQANIGPTFSEFGHSPGVPNAGQTVTVSVVAKDPDSVSSCTLRWRVDGGGWNSQSMTHQGDGLYTKNIPGKSTETVVQFYVEAEDGLMATSTYPAAGIDSRALYKVNDGMAATNGLHNFRIIMTSDDYDFLNQVTNTYTNDRIGATVIYDEHIVYYDVGIRGKGSLYSRARVYGKSYNVRFNADHLLRGVHQGVTVDRVNSVPSGHRTREILVKQILHHVGGISSQYDDLIRCIPPDSSDTTSGQLNLARYSNLYLDSQYQDGSDGMLFKQELVYYPTATVDSNPQSLKKLDSGSALYPWPPIADLGDDPENYRGTYFVRNNRDRDDYSRLIELAKAFELSGQAFLQQAEQLMDIDQWLRAYAWTGVVSTFDNYFGINVAHNHYFFVRPQDDRIVFLPWDNDFTIETITFPLKQTPAINDKILVEPKYNRAYYGHVYDIINTAVNPSYLTYWANHYGSLIPEENFSNYLAFYLDRADWILTTQLPVQVPFEISDPDFTTVYDYAVVEGKAWIDVAEIYIEGRPNPLELTWTSTGSGIDERFYWQVTVGLERGKNHLTFLAYDFQGNLIASDTITITSTASE